MQTKGSYYGTTFEIGDKFKFMGASSIVVEVVGITKAGYAVVEGDNCRIYTLTTPDYRRLPRIQKLYILKDSKNNWQIATTRKSAYTEDGVYKVVQTVEVEV